MLSADFWAGYLSGSIGILIGNPLDIIKTKLQAGSSSRSLNPIVTTSASCPGTSGSIGARPASLTSSIAAPLHTTPPGVSAIQHWSNLVRGSAAPILGCGALTALLYVTYNRSLAVLDTGDWSGPLPREGTSSSINVFTAGAIGGFVSFIVSAPTEFVKCRSQLAGKSSWQVTRETWAASGLRGLYLGGAVTSVRDAVGYGFYFWSYELSKSALSKRGILGTNGTDGDESHTSAALNILLSGGIAGVVTWASIFPLDVIKTRLQTWDLLLAMATLSAKSKDPMHTPLLGDTSDGSLSSSKARAPSSWTIARHAYQTEGMGVFFRGLGVCSVRAFIVNAVQWATYEWAMKVLAP